MGILGATSIQVAPRYGIGFVGMAPRYGMAWYRFRWYGMGFVGMGSMVWDSQKL